MTKRAVMILAKHTEVPLPPKFARKCIKGKTFEYGFVAVDHVDRSKDKYTVVGKASSLAEAMRMNGMEVMTCQ